MMVMMMMMMGGSNQELLNAINPTTQRRARAAVAAVGHGMMSAWVFELVLSQQPRTGGSP
eukprot:1146132-Pelagomonas_calceolata.AAC.4